MWTPDNPNDFSQFNAFDMPGFLEWWESRHTEALSMGLAGAFVEGITQPWLEIAEGDMPEWVKAMLRWRMAAMWTWQQGEPLSHKLERGIGALVNDLPARQKTSFQLTPTDIANVPPAVRQAFLKGNSFSMGWIKRLSGDAREMAGDLLSVQTLQARNPMDAIPLLENVLRRELVARERGIPVGEVTGEDITRWTQAASNKLLSAIAHRAQLITRTEQMRMMNLGILTSMEEQGETLCFVMPHAGSCPDCQKLVDGRVFTIKTLKDNLFVNFGTKREFWKPALPQHPQCRHSPGPVPWQFKKALASITIPPEGILLRWYGLSSVDAFTALEMERNPWMMPNGSFS